MKTTELFKISLAGLALALLAAFPVYGALIDFEDLASNDFVDDHYSNVRFTNAMVLQAGFTLNEWDFPPRSGTNVVVDNTGAIELLFRKPISEFSAFITYVTTLNVNAYSSENILLGQLVSLTNDNTFFSGNNPNENFSFNIEEGISRILIEGSVDGDSFVMDDISFELADLSTPPTHDVPEPSTGGLALLGLILLWRKWRFERTSSDSAIKRG